MIVDIKLHQFVRAGMGEKQLIFINDDDLHRQRYNMMSIEIVKT